MKITVEAVFSYIPSNGKTLFNKVYLNNNFVGCLGFMGKLEFEAEKGENEIRIVDENNSLKNKTLFASTENVYFWIAFNRKINMCIELYGKGEDYKLISESKA